MLAQAAWVVVRDWWLAGDSKFKPGKGFDIIGIGSSADNAANGKVGLDRCPISQ
jgi:hypothetical protein